ncbi:MAG TPA: gluconeogenesis factor YvcK family protein [Acidimicrobiia bacterium]
MADPQPIHPQTGAGPSVDGPSVVALGGGHGLATALRAIRRYAGSITAVVSVADDGGSSGRLRRDLGVPPPGDIRRCLVALAGDDGVWSPAFEHRFRDGELEGHALGNLVLVGLTETLGSFPAALDEAGRLLKAVGRVVPATVEPVVLKAELSAPDVDGRVVEGLVVEGQVAVANSREIRRVELVPSDVAATPDAVDAILVADQVVYAPGSLYTSVLPVLCVAGLREAIVGTRARVVQVANLRPQVPETSGMDLADHLAAVLAHGARVDTLLHDTGEGLPIDPERLAALADEWGVEVVAARVARADGLAHDHQQLARALCALL